MNDTIKSMIEVREAKKAELIERSKKSEDVNELRSINSEIDDINGQIAELRSLAQQEEKAAEERKAADDKVKAEKEAEARTAAVDTAQVAENLSNELRSAKFVQGKGFEKRDSSKLGGDADKEERMAKFGEDLKERRSVTVASSDIILPKFDAKTIKPGFLEISNLIDAVSTLNLPGGESYTQPYEKATAAGDYTPEGADYNEADVTFGHADIAKAKITAYSEMTEELEKLPAAPYAQVILDGIQKSVRKKIAKEIMVGAGTANTIVGIFSAKADAIDAATDKELAKIDNTTLDEIVFSYGGDEAVEGQCVLILSKADLKAFSSIRTTDGKPFYDIKIAGNGGSGTINTVPFIINSACGSITDSKTTEGTYCMAYGNLQNYQLTVFSQLDIRRSDDFKFKSGMIAHRGSVFVGGNVVSYNGFLRIKKAATA